MIPLITKRFSFLGDLKEYVSSPIEYLEKKAQLHGDTFRFRVAGRKITYTGNPDMIKEILQTKHRSFQKSKSYNKLKLLLGEGLFTSEGDYWLKQRRLIQPAFSNAQLTGYIEQIETICEHKYNKLQKGEQINIKDFFIDLTLEIITQCLLGLKDTNESDQVNKHLPNALSFMINRITSPLAPPVWFPNKENKEIKNNVKELNNIIRSLIKDKKQHLGNDLLSTLIQVEDADTGEKMSEQQLIDETLTIFLAGHETTAIALTWLIYSLLKNKDYLDQVYEECTSKPLQELMGNSITKACINEKMRLYSPIWVLGRAPLENTTIGKYVLKPKEAVIFFIEINDIGKTLTSLNQNDF